MRFSRLPIADSVLCMGDTSSGQTGVLGDCSPDDVDVDGVENLVGVEPFVVQIEIVCNSPLCSLSDRGVR